MPERRPGEVPVTRWHLLCKCTIVQPIVVHCSIMQTAMTNNLDLSFPKVLKEESTSSPIVILL